MAKWTLYYRSSILYYKAFVTSQKGMQISGIKCYTRDGIERFAFDSNALHHHFTAIHHIQHLLFYSYHHYLLPSVTLYQPSISNVLYQLLKSNALHLTFHSNHSYLMFCTYNSTAITHIHCSAFQFNHYPYPLHNSYRLTIIFTSSSL